ncbi:MAG: condensation domain-containing protein, partial [Chloroflexota bacterium]
MSEARQRHLQQRLEAARRRLAGGGLPAEIPRREWRSGQPAPLSFAQERLFFLYRLAPDNPLYNRPVALRLSGALHLPTLEGSLAELLRRHSVLRSTFLDRDGAPYIVLQPPAPVRLPLVDLDGASPQALDARLRQDSHAPIDLEHGPLARFTLYRLGPQEHVLLGLIHHIAFDAWSANWLAAELAGLYAAPVVKPGEPGTTHPHLPEPPIQYADYAVWQREKLDRAALAPLLDDTLAALSGASLEFDLPADRSRPPVQDETGERYTFLLPIDLATGLRRLAVERNATLFTVLLAGFAALLYRYTGEHDFVLGTPVAGRTHLELEKLIGFFVNMVPLRCTVDGEQSVSDLLEGVRAVTQRAFNRQALPFDRLVEALHLQPNLSRPPVFSVVFNLKNLPPAAAGGPLAVELYDFDDGISPYDLSLEVAPVRGQGGEPCLECRLVYATALFDRWRIEQMGRHYLAILRGMLSETEARVARLPMLDESELHQVLDVWGAAPPSAGELRLAHEWVAEQARRRPAATALVEGGRRRPRVQVSYAQLNRRANRLAHYLQSLGIGVESTVGVLLPRGVD